MFCRERVRRGSGNAPLDWNEAMTEMAGNVIRAKGRGKVLNRGKTENAVRDIPLPDWCVRMSLDRRERVTDLDGPIFPSTTGTVREASNVRNRAWRPFVARAGYEWVTFRTFRKTVATLLDEAGLTARQIGAPTRWTRLSLTPASKPGVFREVDHGAAPGPGPGQVLPWAVRGSNPEPTD